MKIILTKDLENLGKAGALVEVKPGYGRNYLLPRGMAVAASSGFSLLSPPSALPKTWAMALLRKDEAA